MTLSSSDDGRKQKLDKLKKACKMGVKEGYRDKYNMETPKKVDPFYNNVEGHKISSLTVHGMFQNRLHVGQINHASLR